ncbi:MULTISPECIES: cytochrome aa3 quinol oxidase subunit IV [Bacillaceae]|uniref:cytochrome aa3 quinol oxidase subunit IV n=1 Tax=Bacillaceae TaxID=186817 RepID=UPI0006AD8F61|nr:MULTISPECIES: cytochrome aa3 quinol oxidase subunit IV [Bacillaceae]ALC86816.1 cytochrome aa3 quinol oxidase subunit IV [Bacillus sp. FJAT-22090]KQL37288.1 cytochrome aa3 quinol oxidase subunit IV [Psychrobacillus sp. FJAT-21963]MDF2067721.1 cytochrome aa3 quinol oxidase subunit IV [Bacillus sp. Cr_A10]
MKELFPLKQVMGFAFSLVLTAVALLVYFTDMSYSIGMTVLLLTAFIQAGLQLVVFMHAGETNDKNSIYVNIYYGLILAILTILGTLLTLVWDM